jgi:response regulator RpfG family c-di-GMP phosphodiesterase
MIRVLYVDDEINNLEAFNAAFRREFEVFTAVSAAEASRILEDQTIHVLICDQRMPETTGTQLLADAVKKYPDQVRILLTAYADIEALIEAVNYGLIFKYLKKPWDENELRESIVSAYEHFLYLDDLKKAADILKGLIKKRQNEIDLRHKRKLGLDGGGLNNLYYHTNPVNILGHGDLIIS